MQQTVCRQNHVLYESFVIVKTANDLRGARRVTADDVKKMPATTVQGGTLLLLASLIPVLDFGLANMTDNAFLPRRLGIYFLGLLLCGIILAVFVKLIAWRSRAATALIVAAGLVFAFFSYNYAGHAVATILLSGATDERTVLMTFGAVAIVVVALATFISRSRGATGALLFAGVAMTALTGFQLGYHLVFTEGGRAALSAKAENFAQWPRDPANLSKNIHVEATTPAQANVYYIIPDMFMGESEFAELVGSEHEMGDRLRERGFEVIPNYYSNAPITRFSLAHVFGGAYFAEEGDQVTSDMLRLLPWRINNDVMKEFRRRGYSIFNYIDPYVTAQCDPLADFCFAPDAFLQGQDLIFMERAPLGDIMAMAGDTRVNVWRRLLTFPGSYEIPAVMNYLPQPGASPHFTFMHFGLPHSPYRFNEDCQYYDAYPPIRRNTLQGSTEAYARQVACATRLYTQLLDRIIERDPEAIIVFQADHGVNYYGQDSGVDIYSLSDEAVRQNLSILGGYKMPDRCIGSVRDPNMSPVNTFAVVFACLDGTEPALLEPKNFLMYYLSWQPAAQIRDVTQIVGQRRASSPDDLD